MCGLYARFIDFARKNIVYSSPSSYFHHVLATVVKKYIHSVTSLWGKVVGDGIQNIPIPQTKIHFGYVFEV